MHVDMTDQTGLYKKPSVLAKTVGICCIGL